jgi:hypothetical protein
MQAAGYEEEGVDGLLTDDKLTTIDRTQKLRTLLYVNVNNGEAEQTGGSFDPAHTPYY